MIRFFDWLDHHPSVVVVISLVLSALVIRLT